MIKKGRVQETITFIIIDASGFSYSPTSHPQNEAESTHGVAHGTDH